MTAVAKREWVAVPADEIENLQGMIRQQKGQLALAFAVLVSLGFDPDELTCAV